MTELQQTEFHILQEFIRICTELNLTYYLVCGSALGAVKYSGFVPWDDDIDVALPRPDYTVFLKQAPALLEDRLFLQNYQTDPAFPAIYSKLRDSHTTFIEKTSASLPINHGVYIDIFPLDGYPYGKISQWWLEARKRIYSAMLQTAFEYPRPKVYALFCRFCRGVGITHHTDRIAAKLDQILSGYTVEDSRFLCNHGNWQGKLEYASADQYDVGVEACFEGLKVRIPLKYNAYLRQKYGDYLREPDEREKLGHHTYSVCDCRTPYTQYEKKS